MRIGRLLNGPACTFFVLGALLMPPAQAAEVVQLALIERNPWLMVVGSDTPTFVLYESNRAIWKAGVEDGPVFLTTVLTDEESLGLQSMAGALLALDEYLDLSDWTDQPSQEIYFRSSGELSLIHI